MSRLSAVVTAAFAFAVLAGCSEKPARTQTPAAAEEAPVATPATAGDVDDYDIFAEQGPASAREAGSSLFGTVDFDVPETVVPGAEGAPAQRDAAPADDRIEM